MMFPRSNACEISGTLRGFIWASWQDSPDEPDLDGAAIAKLADGTVVKGPCREGDLEPGTDYRFLGRWDEHHKHGKQFLFSTFCVSEPASRRGVIRYLVKMAPNIGEIRAEQLWEKFGSQAVKVLREQPQAVVAAGLLSADQAKEASDELHRKSAFEATKIDLFTLFDRRGFPRTLIDACLQRWGARAALRIRQNAFNLLVGKPKLPGCGFTRVDKLYLDLGGNRNRLKRQMMAAWHHLREDLNNGHTWVPFGAAREAIFKRTDREKATPDRAILLGIRAKWLRQQIDRVGMKWVAEVQKAKNERIIAERLAMLRAAPALWSNAWKDIVGGEGSISEHQRDRLRVALAGPVGILNGSPGVGKTFTLAQVVKYLACNFGLDSIAVCCPTGKAAVRATFFLLQNGLDLPATTIHRLLQVNRNGRDGEGWGFLKNESNPLPQRFIVCDEISMGDTDIIAALLTACAPGTHILFVGDTGQLPPVGHGAPLRDMLAAGVPCGELTEIHRNSGLIVQACKAIKEERPFETATKFDDGTGQNLRHIDAPTDEHALAVLQAILRAGITKFGFDPIWDCQVIVAVNESSILSRKYLNGVLQQDMNPEGETCPGNPFRVGDKIMCVKNSDMALVRVALGEAAKNVDAYEDLGASEFVANGETAKVLAVGPKTFVARLSEPPRTIKVYLGKVKDDGDGDDGDGSGSSGGNGSGSSNGGDGEQKRTGNGCDFVLAYAVTGHKMQGSEAPVVIVMIDETEGAKRVISREWVYTALSRAKKLCITIGRMPVLEQYAKKKVLGGRKTFLRELLLEQMEPAAGMEAGK